MPLSISLLSSSGDKELSFSFKLLIASFALNIPFKLFPKVGCSVTNCFNDNNLSLLPITSVFSICIYLILSFFHQSFQSVFSVSFSE